MHVEYIIVGQGISGTMLTWFLHREGKSFVVIDEDKPNTSSKVAAGVINPVTGRRYSVSWMIDTIMPFAVQTYKELGDYFNTSYVFQKNIIEFFPTPQSRNAFVERIGEDIDPYFQSYPDQNHFNQFFHYDFGCGEIRPVYTVHLSLLMADWRKKLIDTNALVEQRVNLEDLQVTDKGVQYGDITAEKIIFCEGAEGNENPWFRLLPYAPNKGEALVIRSEELTNQHIFKKGMSLVPLPVQHTFWLGSSFAWEYADHLPTEKFLQQGTELLKNWLKVPFEVISQRAAVRPATVERRPFVGMHPYQSNVGIFNGMGTKGTSLSPFFANQLVQHLVHGLPITDAADIHRFNRILAR